jgi:hypothetical protein
MELVVVERTLDPPISKEQIERRLHTPSPCYQLRRIKHVDTVISKDGRRMVCFYEAPDAASVRAASEENGDPFDRIWTAVRLSG